MKNIVMSATQEVIKEIYQKQWVGLGNLKHARYMTAITNANRIDRIYRSLSDEKSKQRYFHLLKASIATGLTPFKYLAHFPFDKLEKGVDFNNELYLNYTSKGYNSKHCKVGSFMKHLVCKDTNIMMKAGSQS